MKTMMQVVQELQNKGHQVDYYIRKDGGILIRRLDGEHFTGAKGNAVARSLTEQSLSEARSKQLKYATKQRKKIKRKLPDSIEEAYKRVKKKWNKAFHAKKGTPHPAGYLPKSHIRYIYENEGEEAALAHLLEAEKYSSGLAYSKNVEHLAGYIYDVAAKLGSDELTKLAEDLLANAFQIRDEWIYPAYEKLYDLNRGIDPKQIAQEVRRILRL